MVTETGCGQNVSLPVYNRLKRNYQILAILFVDGDHPTLCSTLPAGPVDADVGDIREVTQGLQLLDEQHNKQFL